MTHIFIFSLLFLVFGISCDQDNQPVDLSPVIPNYNFEQPTHQSSEHIFHANDTKNHVYGHNQVTLHIPDPIPLSQAQYLRFLPSSVMLSKNHAACKDWDIHNYANALAEQQIGTIVTRGSHQNNVYPWFSRGNQTLCFNDNDLRKIYGMLHLYEYPRFILTLRTMPRFHDYMPAVAAALQSSKIHKYVSKEAKQNAKRLDEQAEREKSRQITTQQSAREIGGIEDHDRPEAVADDYDDMPECIQEAWKERHAAQCAQEESQDFRYQEYMMSDVFAEFLGDVKKNCELLKHKYGTALQHAFHKEILQIGDLAARTRKYEELELFQFSQMLFTAVTCNEKSQHRLTGAALDYCWAVADALKKWPDEYWNDRCLDVTGKLIDKIASSIKSLWKNRANRNTYVRIGKGILQGLEGFGNMIEHPIQTAQGAAGVISYVAVKFCLNAGVIAGTTVLRGPLAGIEVAKQASFDFRDFELEVCEKLTSMSNEEFLEASLALGTETVLTLGSGKIIGKALQGLAAVDAAALAESADTSKGFFNQVKNFFKGFFSSGQPDAFSIIEGADSIAIQAGMQLGGIEVAEVGQTIALTQEAANKAKRAVNVAAQATAAAKAGTAAAGGPGPEKNIPIKSYVFSDECLFEELLKLKEDSYNLANRSDLPFDKVYFTEKQLKHVFAFEQTKFKKPSGKIIQKWGGFHHDYQKNLEIGKVFDIRTTQTFPDGTYRCAVTYMGETCTKNTMFPSDLTPTEVFDLILESLDKVKKIAKEDRAYIVTGYTNRGIEIRNVFSEIGQHITSYPDLEKWKI